MIGTAPSSFRRRPDLTEATAEAGCWKLAETTSAYAFTGKPAGHARMPPGRKFDRLSQRGFHAPLLIPQEHGDN